MNKAKVLDLNKRWIRTLGLKYSQINGHFALEKPHINVFEVKLFNGGLQIALSRCYGNNCYAIVAIATVLGTLNPTIRFPIGDLVLKHQFLLLNLIYNGVNKP